MRLFLILFFACAAPLYFWAGLEIRHTQLMPTDVYLVGTLLCLLGIFSGLLSGLMAMTPSNITKS